MQYLLEPRPDEPLAFHEPAREHNETAALEAPMVFASSDALAEHLLDLLMRNGHPLLLSTLQRSRMKAVLMPTEQATEVFSSLLCSEQAALLRELCDQFHHTSSFQAFEGIALGSARMDFHRRLRCSLPLDADPDNHETVAASNGDAAFRD